MPIKVKNAIFNYSYLTVIILRSGQQMVELLA